MSENDTSTFMREALRLAEEGAGRTSPNPAVGTVIVKDGEIVGRGYHVFADRKHAEVVALEQAAERAKGATVYVTLEPCSHTGRTGPCAQALLDAGVGRVVTAMRDPNPEVSGRGLDMLRSGGVNVEVADEFAAPAQRMNEAYVHFMRTGRPLVFVKAALTLDGKISAPDDNSGWITSELARLHVQKLRHHSDAILTGIGTVLADDCLLTDRSGRERSRPLLRIVLDSQLRIPLDSKMVRSAHEDLVIATTSHAPTERRKALERAGAEVIAFDARDGRVDVVSVVSWLAEKRCLSLMVEAGSRVNWAFFESCCADKIFFYYAPKILGGMQSLPVAGGVGRRRRSDALRFRNLQVHNIAPDEFAVEAWLEK